MIIDENCSDIDDSDRENNVTTDEKNDSIISPKFSNNEVMKNINEIIQTIDETDSGIYNL